jgi:hypothetical protein
MVVVVRATRGPQVPSPLPRWARPVSTIADFYVGLADKMLACPSSEFLRQGAVPIKRGSGSFG